MSERIYNSFFIQAGDGIRGLVRSRGFGDVYKGQVLDNVGCLVSFFVDGAVASLEMLYHPAGRGATSARV